MKKAQATIIIGLAALAMIGARPGGGDDFYVVRLKAGEAALRAQRDVDAIDQLRIANFGLLDRPALLVEGLAALALAYAQADRPADVDATLTRLVEVESRFSVFEKAEIEPDVRARVEDLLKRRVRREVLAQIPSLARLVAPPPTPTPKVKRPTPTPTPKPPPPTPTPTPTPGKPAPSRSPVPRVS